MHRPAHTTSPSPSEFARSTLPPRPYAAFIAIRWLAKLSSLAVGVTLIFILFASRQQPKGSEWLGVAFFPLGVAFGLLLGLWRELLGAVVAISSLATFYFMFIVVGQTVPKGPYFAILSSPALLLLISGLLARRTRRA